MPHITPDFSEASEFENKPIPPGVYKARIVDCEEKLSKSFNKYLSWKLSIFGAEGELAKQNNRPLFMMTMLDGKAAGRLRDLLNACDMQPGPFDTDQLLGKEIEITLQKQIDRQTGLESNWPDVKRVSAIKG